ncbi:MAG: iron-sulfur cluster assembly scaffold protein [Patescibacteria group bacterium]
MDIYAQNILDHYKHPRHKEPLPAADATERGSNASCGDDLMVALQFSGQKIKALSFQGHGCAISQAAISILTEALVGKTKNAVLAMDFKTIQSLLGVPISERRYKCAMLGLSTIQKAIKKAKA